MARDIDSSVTIILDRWPTTETEFEGLISSLRLEFSVQVERRFEEEAGICSPYPHFKPYISMILLNECDWQSDCIMNLVLWKLGHV